MGDRCENPFLILAAVCRDIPFFPQVFSSLLGSDLTQVWARQIMPPLVPYSLLDAFHFSRPLDL